MFWSDDPHKDYDRYDAARQRELDRLPKCANCGEPIQDEYCYSFDGDLFCPECLNEHHRKRTENYCQ